MTDRELMQIALKYLEESDNYLGSLDHSKPIAALRNRLAQPEQEPPQFPTMLRKMWSGGEVQRWINENWSSPQPRREWVGLTEEDMPDGEDPMYDDPRFIAGMVWANNKLREKNA